MRAVNLCSIVATLFLWVGALGCEADEASTGAGGTSDTSSTGMDTVTAGAGPVTCDPGLSIPYMPSCSPVLRGDCCPVARKCADDAKCAALWSCKESCDPLDFPCLDACDDAHPDAGDAVQKVWLCLAKFDTCRVDEECAPKVLTEDNACDHSQSLFCCDEARSCFEECSAFIACALDCATTACSDACEVTHGTPAAQRGRTVLACYHAQPSCQDVGTEE